MTLSHPFPDIINNNRNNNIKVVVTSDDEDDNDDDTERVANNNDSVVVDEPVRGMEMPFANFDPSLDNANDGYCSSSILRRRKTLVVLGGLIFLLAVVGSLVSLLYNTGSSSGDGNPSSSSANKESLLALRQTNDIYYRNLQRVIIRHVYRGKYQPSIFLTPNAPQLLAIQWMAYVDTLHFPLEALLSEMGETTNESDINTMKRAISQRYALMTLFFSNRIDTVSQARSTEVIQITGDLLSHDSAWDRNTEANSSLLERSGSTKLWTQEDGVGLDECQWTRVECDDQGRITLLQLAGHAMMGSLPREIGLLHRLTHLDLSNNIWIGRLPTELYDLTHLETLNLSVNQLGGSVSSEIGRLQKLKHLIIHTNDLTGIVPSSIKHLSLLEKFHMSVNPLLGGPVLSYISSSNGGIVDLDVSQTAVSGTIPTEFGGFTKLTRLGLWKTKISGTIPTEIGNWKAMEIFKMGYNEVVGTLPTEVGLMTNLEYFGLEKTSMTGTIPSEIGLWTNARAFVFRDSVGLRGTIPKEVAFMRDLEIFHLSTTNIQGTLSSELGLLEYLSSMRFDNTELSGSVPEEICNLQLDELFADCSSSMPGVPPDIECDEGCCTRCYVV